ncbi:MAG: hypothetical protein ACRENN_11700, partial [Candidatus Eiseniibacteriota bacterium]
MKALRIAVALAGLLIVAPSFAQTVNDELEAARAQIHADRKAIVAKLMTMTETESAGFWPIYNTYREDVRKTDDKLVTLMKDYATQESTLTDVQAQKMLDQYNTLRAEKLGLQKSYVKKFGKALPAKKLIRYYQIENKMDAIIQYDL